MTLKSDTGPFAIIPEWVLDIGLSSRAVHLYAVLGRYADRKGEAWPSRSTLALRLGCQMTSVDRALTELKNAQAVAVTARLDHKGGQHANLYTIRRVTPSPYVTPPLPIDGDPPSPPVSPITRTSEREPINLHVSADAETLCAHLATHIKANGCKAPTITRTWLDAARLLLDKDKRPLLEAIDLITWATNDEFWRANILSMPTFRQQYDKLRLARARPRKADQLDGLRAYREANYDEGRSPNGGGLSHGQLARPQDDPPNGRGVVRHSEGYPSG